MSARNRLLTLLIATALCLLSTAAQVLLGTAAQAEQTPAAEAPSSYEKTMLVLDVSGSMWGQLSGTSKIEIARDALKEVVADWPEQRESGLVAYGHRSKGDCKDIETLLKVAPVDKAALGKIVDGLTPKGMTPLSDAVVHAAEELKYTEQKASVILISDGIETCDRDPCEVGKELEKLGIDFTAHVIGFDVSNPKDQAKLKCLAENTGGMFISASNAEQLSDALNQTTQLAPPVPLPQASISAPEKVVKGTEAKVTLSTEARDVPISYVYLYPKGSERSLSYVRVEESTRVGYEAPPIRMPANIGEYVLRWETSKRDVLAETTIATTEADIKISAPATATKGTEVKVLLDAPAGLEGYVYLYPKGRDSHLAYQRVNTDAQGNYQPVEIRLPAEVAEFELRWESGKHEVLATTSIETTEADVKLIAAEAATKGTELKVDVEAPVGLAGYVYLYPQGRESHITYARVNTDAHGRYETLTLRLPAQVGAYQLRWESNSHEVLAERPLEVTDAVIALSAPSEAVAGTSLTVNIEAPEGLSGYIYLYPLGGETHLTYGSVRSDAYGKYEGTEIRLPAEPGSYELRFESNKHEVYATAPLELSSPSVALNAPESAPSGTAFDVDLTAPDGLSGYVYLFPKGRDRHTDYAKVREKRDGSYQTISLSAPMQSGSYELQWQTSKKEVLATKDIEVVAAEVSLSLPDSVTAEQSFEVQLQAPPRISGYLYLYPKGSEKHLSYKPVREDRQGGYSAMQFTAPKVPGDYELRWLTSKKELVSEKPLSVEAGL